MIGIVLRIVMAIGLAISLVAAPIGAQGGLSPLSVRVDRDLLKGGQRAPVCIDVTSTNCIPLGSVVGGGFDLASGLAASNIIGGTSLDAICPGTVLGSMDVAACLQGYLNAQAASKTVYIYVPCGDYTYTAQVKVPVTLQLHGAGACAKFTSAQPAGSNAAGFLDVLASAPNSIIDNITIDGQQAQRGFSAPASYPLAALILMEADYGQVTNVQAKNAFDNCIAFGRLNGTTLVQTSPRGASWHAIATSQCGAGTYAGAGIDDLTGSFNFGSGLTDVGSYGCFIVDEGAGANGNFSNISCLNNVYNQRNASGGHNHAVYIGGGPTSLNNVQIFLCGDRGIWLDQVQTAIVTGLSVKACAGLPIRITGSNVSLISPQVDSPGYQTAAWSSAATYNLDNLVTYGGKYWKSIQQNGNINQTPAAGSAYWQQTPNAAILVDSSIANIANVKIIDPIFVNNFSTGDVGVQNTGGRLVCGSIYGGSYAGVTVPTSALNTCMTFLAPNGSTTNGPALLTDGNVTNPLAGCASEAGSQLQECGVNDGRFGTQVAGAQGGFERFDSRAGSFLWTIYGRAPNVGSASPAMKADNAGNIYANTYNTMSGALGYSGSKTAGACTFTISGGIITAVQGC